jgi:hypothetical protein
MPYINQESGIEHRSLVHPGWMSLDYRYTAASSHLIGLNECFALSALER